MKLEISAGLLAARQRSGTDLEAIAMNEKI